MMLVIQVVSIPPFILAECIANRLIECIHIVKVNSLDIHYTDKECRLDKY